MVLVLRCDRKWGNLGMLGYLSLQCIGYNEKSKRKTRAEDDGRKTRAEDDDLVDPAETRTIVRGRADVKPTVIYPGKRLLGRVVPPRSAGPCAAPPPRATTSVAR